MNMSTNTERNGLEHTDHEREALAGRHLHSRNDKRLYSTVQNTLEPLLVLA